MHHSIRLDWFICLVLGTLIVLGIIKLDSMFNLSDVLSGSNSAKIEEMGNSVADGDVGGKALDSTLRVSSLEELATVGDENFTIEMTRVGYIDTYKFSTDECAWVLLEFNDTYHVLTKINTYAIIESGESYSTMYTLPVGALVMEEPTDALESIPESYSSSTMLDCYIDMSGDSGVAEANKYHKSQPLAVYLGIFYIILILIIHKIGVKIGICKGDKIGKFTV